MQKTIYVMFMLAAIMALFTTPAKAEYRIMKRSETAHIVLLNSHCMATPKFAPNHNEKAGFIIDGANRTPGCWYQNHQQIVFTFIASGITLYYNVNDFRYIGPSNYVNRYGQLY